jgi:hypothetical protein
MKSLGVRRVEAINAELTRWLKVTLFVGLFLVAYSYGLDGTLRYTYQVRSFATLLTHLFSPLSSPMRRLRTIPTPFWLQSTFSGLLLPLLLRCVKLPAVYFCINLEIFVQPTVAKLMDVFGRFEVLAVSIVFYVVGGYIQCNCSLHLSDTSVRHCHRGYRYRCQWLCWRRHPLSSELWHHGLCHISLNSIIDWLHYRHASCGGYCCRHY